jgi:hypothetical protein
MSEELKAAHVSSGEERHDLGTIADVVSLGVTGYVVLKGAINQAKGNESNEGKGGESAQKG